MRTLRWGLLACGNIAKALARGLSETDSGDAMAAASRSLDKAKEFAKEFGIPKAYGSYEELLADPEIDVVYISTPHPMHAEWSIKAADAGKHILCEKPITINQYDAMTVIEAARRNDVFLMEAFMYRCNPQTAKLVELVRDGEIGNVKIINSVFSFDAGEYLEGRLLNPKLGGGGILDVGCYATSMSRLIAGAAQGLDFADPIEVQGMGHRGEKSRVDEWAAGMLRFEGDIIARIATGVRLNQPSDVVILGSEGSIVVPSPWMCNGHESGEAKILLSRAGKDTEEIVVAVAKGIYAIEADTVAANIKRRQALSPAMSWDDSLGNMATLDKWRAAIGVEYPSETVEGYATTLSKTPLDVRQPCKMKYGEVPGIDKKISRLVMGMDNQVNIAHATAMYDDFFERGGTCFDTAFIYGGGQHETLFGQWVRNRDIREQVVLLDKGAHTPSCYPDALVNEFDISLERLQMDYVDIYCMHRDDPEVPVGEFVDVLNELKDKGQLRVFGGSNWTVERFEAANEYARKNNKTGFTILSNNFSLARMVKAPWDGCVASSSPEFRTWHETTQTPLLAWSATSKGFFVPGVAPPEGSKDGLLVHSWYADDNFERQKRCFRLAKKKGVHPVTLALSYVLHQKFPVFALIGPRRVSETVGYLEVFGVELTDDEVRWLNLAE